MSSNTSSSGVLARGLIAAADCHCINETDHISSRLECVGRVKVVQAEAFAVISNKSAIIANVRQYSDKRLSYLNSRCSVPQSSGVLYL
jgi:hypothetical protein